MGNHKQVRNWKSEHWSSELSEAEIRYAKLGFRELVIVASAEFDAALADAIARRLVGSEDEIGTFMGTKDESGRAAAGSFGDRIALAKLLLIISDKDALTFKRIKKLRNTVAHRARIDIKSARIQKELRDILDAVWHPTFKDSIRELVKQEKFVVKLLTIIVVSFRIGLIQAMDAIDPVKPMKYPGFLEAYNEILNDPKTSLKATLKLHEALQE